MTASRALEQEYFALSERYQRLAEEVTFATAERLGAANIKTHSLASRVKTLESVRDKAARKEYDAPLEQIDDIVGVRIVVLFQSDLPRVLELVREIFDVESEDDKVEGGDVREFGYMSIHAICRLPPGYAGARYDDLKGIKFEIQLRTIVMDAWANVSHYLDYKGASSVPSDLRRDFYALSGLFYVADQHFELFFRGAAQSRERATSQVAAGAETGLEINLDTVAALFTRLYPARRRAGAEALSEFVEEVNALGYAAVDALEAALERADRAAREYEMVNPPATGAYADVGIARTGLAILHPGHTFTHFESSPHRHGMYRRFLEA